MNLPVWIPTVLQNVLTPALLVALTLWNADKALSAAGAKLLYDAIEHTTQDPKSSKIAQALEAFLARYFSPQTNFPRFLLSVFVLTLVSLLIVLAIYTSRTVGLFDQLASRGFLRQFVGNGFVVTLAVNCIVFSQYRHLVAAFAADSALWNLGLVLLDLLAKGVWFVVFTAITYVLFALLGDAFGGDPLSALHAVGITIREAVLFRNMSSVYIYSLVLSSFPIFVVIVVKLMIASPRLTRVIQKLLFWLPVKDKPLRIAACAFAIFTAVFALVITLLVWWAG